MRVNIRLPHRVRIERQSETLDSVGQLEDSWSLVAVVAARVEPLTSREIQSGEAANMQTSHRITIRYLSDITTDMRVIFNARTLQIIGIRNVEERNVYQELTCLEGPANA